MSMPSPTLATIACSVAIHAVVIAMVLARGDKSAEPRPAPTLGGESFDVPEVEPDSVEESTPASIPAPARPAQARQPRVVRTEPLISKNAGSSEPSPSANQASSPPLFGAVGERGVVDLATTFTRTFPQAASADPSWTQVPFGSAGAADVSLEIDGSGHLLDTGAQIAGSPSPALREGIKRTILLIRARSFVATAAVTRLHIVGTVSPDAAHDGLHGDVFAIGGSFSGREGNAFFALAVGRRIDLTITRK